MRSKVYGGLIRLSLLPLAAVGCGGDDDGSEWIVAGDGGTGGGGGTAGDGASGSGNSSSGGTRTNGSAGETPAEDPVACPSSVDGLADSFAEAVCRKRVECCTDDYDTCLTEVTEAMDATYVDASAAVERGTAELDCDMFDACSLAIHEAACDDWPAQTGELGQIPVNEPACHRMVTPLIPADQACTYNYECINGLCSRDAGTCVEYVAENGACGGDGQVCDVTSMFCNGAHRCQKRLAKGVACTVNGECESGVCDIDDSGMCVAPGPDMCSYVPSAPPNCALASTPGGNAPKGLPWLAALSGIGFAFGRRRHSKS